MDTILSYKERGKYGDAAYRGNTTGYIIKDLLNFYHPKKVYDPMVGSGTTIDVAKELGIKVVATDLNPKYGGWNALKDEVEESSDFVFLHPPYASIIKYSGNMWGEPHEDDLSRCRDYDDYIKKLNLVQSKMILSLTKNGRIAILVGDVKKNGVLYSIQKDMAWFGSPEQIIIKQQHNCDSDRNNYLGKFIRITHEYVLIFKRDDCLIIPSKITRSVKFNLIKAKNITWKQMVMTAIEKNGGKATLRTIYNEIELFERAKENKHYKEKVRQTLYIYTVFEKIGNEYIVRL